MDELIDKACAAAGGLAKLAACIGQSAQTVSNWRVRGVPILHCLAIEQATAGAVTRRDLRPDDWQRIWPELDTSTTRHHPPIDVAAPAAQEAA